MDSRTVLLLIASHVCLLAVVRCQDDRKWQLIYFLFIYFLLFWSWNPFGQVHGDSKCLTLDITLDTLVTKF